MGAWSGSILQNKKGMVYKTTADSTSLYADAQANTLLNDVFCNFRPPPSQVSEHAPIQDEEGAVVEHQLSSQVEPLVSSDCPSPRCPHWMAKAAKMAKMAKGPVFATETFWLMVKQRRTTLMQQRRPRRAWPPTPQLLLRGPEKQMHHFAHCYPLVGKSAGDSCPRS